MSSVTLTNRRPSKSDDKAEKDQKVATTVDTYGDTFEAPDFAMKDILDAIPADCYERSLVKSFGYLFRDLFFVALFGYVAVSYIHLIPNFSVRCLAWFAYSVINGLFGTGCWVLAHECGHGAFSDYKSVNDTVGWLVHSALLVPYHSWRLSHSKHHKATGHMTRDMVFVPKSREQFNHRRGFSENIEDAPLTTLVSVILQQLFGWIMYLTTNATGQKYPTKSKWIVNHFVPWSPLFDKKDFFNIVLSDIGIGLTATCLYFASKTYGFQTVALVYFAPWVWVNHWLVHITYLQHTGPRMPHYHAEEWTFARGAAATIDRDFGFIGKHIFHDIIETHVLHHYVSRIPFYNGRKGTEAIKKVMGKHYMYDGSNFVSSLYDTYRTCQFVEGDKVLMFRNTNNIGVAPST